MAFPNIASGGNGIELQNAIIVTESQASASIIGSDATINVRNNERMIFGNMPSIIFTGGMPCILGFNYYANVSPQPILPEQYRNYLSHTAIIGADTYTIQLESIETDSDLNNNYTYRCYKNGNPMSDEWTYYGTHYRKLTSFGSANMPYFIFSGVQICPADTSRKFGYVRIRCDIGCHIYKGFGMIMLDDNYNIIQSTYIDEMRLPFSTQAEYDYATALTSISSIPPSLIVKSE